MKLDIDQAFNTAGHSVYEFFQRPGVGFYIPLYQREYSWDKDNIKQLIDDLSKGVIGLLESEFPERELRFLGTVISFTGKKEDIEPIDRTGLPASVEFIIDGQQRLSTISLLAAIIHNRLMHYKFKLGSDEISSELIEAIEIWQGKLIDIFSFDLKKGKIKRKPKIIRGQKDKWVKDGKIDLSYKSELSNFLAKYIESISLNEVVYQKMPIFDKHNKVGKNLSSLFEWLVDDVEKAHINNFEFANANKILNNLNEEYLWDNEREKVKRIIIEDDNSNKKIAEIYKPIIQLFAVSHFMLDRFCFTHIIPMDENWAFDMFQSLNGSGTPLTAIETFKPLVVNIAEQNSTYKGSIEDNSFDKIDSLFNTIKTAGQKTKLTNDVLTSFRVAFDGGKLESHFSQQRNWLNSVYSKLNGYNKQQQFMEFFGNYCEFYSNIWRFNNWNKEDIIDKIENHPDSEIVSLLLQFIISTNHKMSITVIGQLYNSLVNNDDNSIEDFVNGIKFISSFYATWRSALPNSGLDIVYRKYFEVNGFNKYKKIDIQKLRNFFLKYLEKKDILNYDTWEEKSKKYFRYSNSKSIAKLALFCVANDTIPDDKNEGIVIASKKGLSEYLKLDRWNSIDLSTIEHIAPEKGNRNEWDEKIYEDDNYHLIGNLTLLPSKVNTSVGNKGWAVKRLYYIFLSDEGETTIEDIKNKAKKYEVILDNNSLEIINNSKYSSHIKVVSKVDDWNLSIINARGKNIRKIFWDYLQNWQK